MTSRLGRSKVRAAIPLTTPKRRSGNSTPEDDAFFLEREEDDGVEWNISRKIDFSALGQGVRTHIKQHDDPPEEIEYQGIRFRLAESGAGYYHPDGRVAGDEMIYWDYTDSSEDNTLTIEQWG